MNITKQELAALILAAVSGDTAALTRMVLEPEQAAPKLLSNAAVTDAAIRAEKPHLKFPTWLLDGKAMTCVWPLMDLIGGSDKTKKKVVLAMKMAGIGRMTLAHRAASDNGPVPIAKVGAESYYAAIDDVLESVEKVAPRVGKKLVAAFKVRYSV